MYLDDILMELSDIHCSFFETYPDTEVKKYLGIAQTFSEWVKTTRFGLSSPRCRNTTNRGNHLQSSLKPLVSPPPPLSQPPA